MATGKLKGKAIPIKIAILQRRIRELEDKISNNNLKQSDNGRK